MKRILIAAVSVLCVAACGQEPAPAKPAAPSAPGNSAAQAAPVAETKKDEAAHAPETHGMPGMSELFKDKKADGEKK